MIDFEKLNDRDHAKIERRLPRELRRQGYQLVKIAPGAGQRTTMAAT